MARKMLDMDKTIKRLYNRLLKLETELRHIDEDLEEQSYTIIPEEGAQEGLAHLAVSSSLDEIINARKYLQEKNYEKAADRLDIALRYLGWAKTILEREKKQQLEQAENKLINTIIILYRIISILPKK